jgi:hypothetical protein
MKPRRTPTHFDQVTSPQAQEICRAWKEIMGVTLSPGHVTQHLAMLDQWEKDKERILERKVK